MLSNLGVEKSFLQRSVGGCVCARHEPRFKSAENLSVNL